MDNMSDDAKAWLKRTADASKAKIEESHVFAGVVTGNFLKDPVCILQVGCAVLMDKPIVLIVDKGVKLPQKIVKIADLIEYVDTKNQDDMARATESVKRFCMKMDGN